MVQAGRRTLALALAIVLTACGPGADASIEPLSAAPSLTLEPSSLPTATPNVVTPPPSPEPSETPEHTPRFPPSSVEPVALPDGLDQFAWATVVGVEADELGKTTSVRVFAGRLGSGVSHEETVHYDPQIENRLDLEVVVDHDVVAVIRQGREVTAIDIRRIDAWSHLVSIQLDTWVVVEDIRLDARRGMLYAGVPNPDGGFDITRFGFDGSVTKLLSFGERFIPELAAKDVATFTIDDDGLLLVEACGTSYRCRLWTIPPSASSAGDPVLLPSGTPGVCRAIGATPTWLVASDSIVCATDYLPAPLPYRAISRLDGTGHLITDELPGVRRVLTAGGRETAIATTWCDEGSVADVVAIDIESGATRTVLAGLPCHFESSLRIEPQALTGSWVLLTPSRSYDTPSVSAVLLNVATGEQIELSVGAFGYGS